MEMKWIALAFALMPLSSLVRLLDVIDPPGPIYPCAGCKMARTLKLTLEDFLLTLKKKIDTFMQKTKRLYQDTRTQSNLTKLHEDLQDVTKIMTKNMEDLLYR